MYKIENLRDALLEIKPRRIGKSLPAEIKRALGYYPSRSAIYCEMRQLQAAGLVELHKAGKNSMWIWRSQ